MMANMVNLTLFKKKDCHLCDVAKQKLLKLQQEFPFSLTEIDIEDDKAAFERYKYLIPVIEMEGEMVFKYRIDENELKKLLRSSLQ